MLGLSLGLVAMAQAVELTEEQRAAIEARIAPVGELCLQGENCGGAPAAMGAGGAAVAAVIDGEGTYNTACLACHSSGAAGAPIVGDVASWAPRIAKGMDVLYSSGVDGLPGTGMLAKGGRADLSDEAVMAAVDFMIENSQ